MGIQGLLKGLSDFVEKRSVREFANQSLAVDTSSWLHKSVYSISHEYVEAAERSRVNPDQKCVHVSKRYIIKRCEELFANAKIKRIYLVMDGKRCPLKAVTNDDREQRRQANLKEAREYNRCGRRDKAEEKYKTCIKIHANFANAVVRLVDDYFRRRGATLKIIQSPYEADAQLVKLCVDQLADAIITEDSDVLVYAAVCRSYAPILFKLDRHSGNCDAISMRWLFDEKSIPQRHQQKDGKKTNAMDSILRSLANRETRRPGFGVRLFVQACVLTGSDYSPSRLNGVGSVTAFKLLRDNAHRKHEERFRHTLSSLSKKKTGKVDMKDYEENLAQSEAVFYHHPVVHCADKSIVTLTAFRESNADDKTDFHPNLERFGDDLTFLGDLGQKKARGISEIIPDAKLDSPLAGQEIIIKPKKRKRSLPPSQKAESANEQIRGKRQSSELTDIAKLMNPYKKKAKDEVPRQVFAKVDKTKTETKNKSASYDFSQFAHQAEEPRIFGLKAYRKPREDVRFVKAKFDKDGRRMSSGIRERLSDLKSRNADMAARAAERTEWTSSAKASQHGLSSCSRDSANRSSADSGSSAKRNTKKFNLLQHTLSTFGSRKHRRKSWSSEHDDGDFDQPLDLTSDSSNHAFEKQREEMRNAKISQSFGTENNTTSKPPHEVSSSFLESASHLQRSSSRQDIFDEADDDGSSVEQILPREAQVQHPRSRKTSSYFDSGRAGKELQSDPDTFFENVADDDQSVGGVPRVSLLSSESSKYWSNNKSSPHPKSRDTFEDVELNTARNSFTPSSNFDCKPPASEGSSSVVAIDVDNFDDVGKSRHPARRITLDSPPPKERLEDSFTPKESSPGGDSVLSEAGEAPFHSIFAKRTSSPSSFDSRPSSSRSGSKPWRWSYRQQSPQTSLYDHFSKSSSTPASKGPSAPRKALKRTKLDGQITHHFTYKKANEDNEWLE